MANTSNHIADTATTKLKKDCNKLQTMQQPLCKEAKKTLMKIKNLRLSAMRRIMKGSEWIRDKK